MTSPELPSFADIEAKIREIVAARPDFVYPRRPFAFPSSCVYNPIGERPACIFGQAMIDLGHPIPKHYEGNPIEMVLRDMGIAVSERNQAWAASLQVQQDGGMATWSECLVKADKTIEDNED